VPPTRRKLLADNPIKVFCQRFAVRMTESVPIQWIGLHLGAAFYAR
jgi:hypothetical protein